MMSQKTNWKQHITDQLGKLPSGQPVYRTDPGGRLDADIVILGVYPAGRVRLRKVGDRMMNLPVEVERTSFDPKVSESGLEIDRLYLKPLELTRDDVLLIDMMPYFLANVRGSRGRTMWDNLQDYERLTGEQLHISPRPSPAALVRQAREMPGNLDRIRHYLSAGKRRLLLTLGTEAAAFARNTTYGPVSRAARDLFYASPVRLDVVGVPIDTVHLAHPGNLMVKSPSNLFWRETHARWCEQTTLTAHTLK